jgi:hypothetical protein
VSVLLFPQRLDVRYFSVRQRCGRCAGAWPGWPPIARNAPTTRLRMFFCPHAGGARADGGSDPPLALLLAAALASVGSSGQRAARPTGNAPHREMIELIGSLRWRPVHLEGPPALRLTTEERQHPKNRTPDSSLDTSRPHLRPRPHEGPARGDGPFAG